jgi:SAM-dependent methyltransferase
MTTDQAAEYARFCAGYERVRRNEGWGGEDLELPFEPRAHHKVWAVRQRTFKRLDQFLRKQMQAGGTALDAGAGNCWLTRHLDHWGFQATALDVNDGSQDGLAAGASYLEVGDKFERIRAPMESLPFVDGVFDLLVVNGSLHYCQDLVRTLGEFRRVLADEGTIVVMDSPWYERKKDGIRAREANVRELIQKHGLDEDLARRSTFLHRTSFAAATMQNRLEYRVLATWTGWRRAKETLSARFYERRIATFPLLVVRSAK